MSWKPETVSERYDERFSAFAPGNIILGSILKRDYAVRCKVCGKLTHFVNLDHRVFLCSDQCRRKYEREIGK